MNLNPLPGRALVELRDDRSHVATTEKKYDTKTSGICLKASFNTTQMHLSQHETAINYPLVKSVVFWEEYKESGIIQRDGKKYVFVNIEDLDGYEDVKSE